MILLIPNSSAARIDDLKLQYLKNLIDKSMVEAGQQVLF